MNYPCRHFVERANLLHQRFVVAAMMWIKREDTFAEFVELLTRYHVDDKLPFTLQTADNLSADSARVCKDDPAGLLCLWLILAVPYRRDGAFPRRNVEIFGGLMPSLQCDFFFSIGTGVGRIDPVSPSLERIGGKRDTTGLRFARVQRHPINLNARCPKTRQSLQHVCDIGSPVARMTQRREHDASLWARTLLFCECA